MSSSSKQSEAVKELLDIQREEQARAHEELARSNAKVQELLTRMKAHAMELVRLAREEDEGLLQLNVGVENHPAEDAPQVFNESPEVSSNLGVQEEIGKDVQMENEKSPVQMLVEELVDELPPDQMSVPPVGRTLLCTGVVVSVASGLLGVCLPGTGARATALVGGLCAEWLGTIVSKDRSEAIRTHMDFDKDAAPYFQRAVICDNPGAQLVNQGHIMDLFASALVQAEVAEMQVAVETLAAFKLAVVWLVFDPGGEFSAMAAEFLKLEGKLLEGGGNVTEIEEARELHD